MEWSGLLKQANEKSVEQINKTRVDEDSGKLDHVKSSFADLIVVQGRRVTLSVDASLVNDAIDLVGGDADGDGLEGFVQHLAAELAGHAEVWK